MKAIYYEDWDGSYIPHILKEIYVDFVYEPYFQGRSGLTIIDCGANIGLTARYFSKFGRVYAIEPSKRHFEILKKNTEGLDVKLINCAVSNECGEKKFYHNKNVTMFSLSSNINDGSGEEKVKVQTLEKIYRDNKIKKVDFLKIDVEGEEFNVICSPTFKYVADRTNTIMGEIHAWAGRNAGQIHQALKNYGYRISTVKTDATIFLARK